MNPFDIVKNLKNVESQVKAVKDELSKATATGSSGGGIVQATVNGSFELVSIKIDPVAVDPRDVKMLEDLIVAAHHAAFEKIQDIIKEKAGPMLGGLSDMKIPGFGA